MTTFHEVATYLLNVGGVTLIQLFALGGPALLLIALLSWAGAAAGECGIRRHNLSLAIWLAGDDDT